MTKNPTVAIRHNNDRFFFPLPFPARRFRFAPGLPFFGLGFAEEPFFFERPDFRVELLMPTSCRTTCQVTTLVSLEAPRRSLLFR